MITKLFKNFAKDESGAVTVDWVVLTAALVGLGIAVLTVVTNGVSGLNTQLSADLTTATNIATNASTTGGT